MLELEHLQRMVQELVEAYANSNNTLFDYKLHQLRFLVDYIEQKKREQMGRTTEIEDRKELKYVQELVLIDAETFEEKRSRIARKFGESSKGKITPTEMASLYDKMRQTEWQQALKAQIWN